MRLYQLFDRVSLCVIGQVISSKHDGPVIRSFHSVLESKTGPGEFPGDFDILCLGDQDEETGCVVGYPAPVTVATGRAWLELQERVTPLEVMKKVEGA